MNLPKAQEILSQMIIFRYSAAKTDKGDAVKLGLEAIIRIREQRQFDLAFNDKPLPNETRSETWVLPDQPVEPHIL